MNLNEIIEEVKRCGKTLWTMEAYDLLWARIKQCAEQEYGDFSAKLIPEYQREDIIGIRIPMLRKLAMAISKGDITSYLQVVKQKASVANHLTLEEKLLWGFVISKVKCWEKIEQEIVVYIPQIDCWSVCDSFCTSLKIAKEEPHRMFELIKRYIASKETYEIRFAVVMLLDYYIVDDFIDDMFCLLNRGDWTEYYVQMAVAWAISMCYVPYSEKTLDFLSRAKLDRFTYNKALQKMVESKQLTSAQKQFIKTLKRTE